MLSLIEMLRGRKLYDQGKCDHTQTTTHFFDGGSKATLCTRCNYQWITPAPHKLCGQCGKPENHPVCCLGGEEEVQKSATGLQQAHSNSALSNNFNSVLQSTGGTAGAASSISDPKGVLGGKPGYSHSFNAYSPGGVVTQNTKVTIPPKPKTAPLPEYHGFSEDKGRVFRDIE